MQLYHCLKVLIAPTGSMLEILVLSQNFFIFIFIFGFFLKEEGESSISVLDNLGAFQDLAICISIT